MPKFDENVRTRAFTFIYLCKTTTCSLSSMCYNFTSALCVCACVLLFMRMCASPFIALCVMVIVYFSSLNCCCGCLKTELYAKPCAHTNVMCVFWRYVCITYMYMHMGDMSDVCNMGIANMRFVRTCYNTACVRFKMFSHSTTERASLRIHLQTRPLYLLWFYI